MMTNAELARLRELAREWASKNTNMYVRKTGDNIEAVINVNSLAALLASQRGEATDAAVLAVREACVEAAPSWAGLTVSDRPTDVSTPESRAYCVAVEDMRRTIRALDLSTIAPRAAKLARVVEAARAWKQAMDDTMAEWDRDKRVVDDLCAAIDALADPAEGARDER